MGQQIKLEAGIGLIGGTQQAFNTIANGFRAVATGMQTSAAAMRALGQSSKSGAYDKAAKSFYKAADGVQKHVDGLNELKGAQTKAEKSTKDLTAVIDKQEKALESDISAVAKLSAEEEKAAKAADKLSLDQKVLSVSYKHLFKERGAYSVAGKAYIASLDREGSQIRLVRANLSNLSKAYRTSATAVNKTATAMARIEASYPDYSRYISQIKKTTLSQESQVKVIRKFIIQKEKERKAIALSDKAATAEAIATAKLVELKRVLGVTYIKLLGSQSSYAVAAKRYLATLNQTGVSTARVRAQLASLNTAFLKSTRSAEATAIAYRKLETSFPRYAKQIAHLKKSSLTQEEQLRVLERLIAKNKALDKVAAANSKSLKKLNVQYMALLRGTDRFSIAAQKIYRNLGAGRIAADKAAAGMANLAAQQKLATASMTPLQTAVGRLGKSFKTYLSYVLASSAVFAALQVFRDAKDTVVEFDQSLRDLQAITQSTAENTARMGEKIKKVAATTKFSATEVAAGMKLIGQSGRDAYDAINMIDGITNLATGTLTDMATTVDLVTTTMAVFNKSSEQTTEVTDSLANAVNRSKLTIDKIRIAMNYIGPVASAAGASLNETMGAMMLLANQGIRASTIGTGLRQVFRRLVDPTSAMQRSLAAAAMDMHDLDPAAVGLAQVLENLKSVVVDNQAAFEMFGQRGATAVIALTKEGSAGLEAMLSVVSRTGTAADMAATQLRGLGLSFKQLQDKIRNLYLAWGDAGLYGVLRLFVDTSRALVDLLTGMLSSSIVQFTAKILLAAGAVRLLTMALTWLAGLGIVRSLFLPLTASVTAFAGAAAGATAAQTALNAALAIGSALFKSMGIGLIVAGFAGLIRHIALMDDKLQDSIIDLKAQRQEHEDNAFALEVVADKILAFNGTAAEKEHIVQRLINKYPEWRKEIEATGGDIEKLEEFVRGLAEEERKLERSAGLEKLCKEFELLKLTAHKTKIREELSLFTTESFNKETEAMRKGLDKLTADYAKEFDAFTKKNSGVTVEGWLKTIAGDELGFDIPTQKIADQIRTQLKEIEDEAIAAAARTQQNIADGILDAEMPTEFNFFTPGMTGDDVTDRYEQHKKLREKDLQDSLYAIEVSAAKGKITHDNAEKAKLDTTLRTYEVMRDAAKEYLEWSGLNPEETADAMAEFQKTEQALTKIKLDRLKAYGQDAEKINTKISAQDDKLTAEKTKNADTLADFVKTKRTAIADHDDLMSQKETEIWSKAADAKAEIQKNLEAKLKDLRQKRVDAEKDAETDIQGISDDLQDKLLSIRQRGMSEQQKQSSTASAANQRYQAGLQALSEARRSMDSDALERARELIGKSGEYYASLENSSQAESGVRRVAGALQEARKVQESIEKTGIEKEIVTVKALAAEKKRIITQAATEELADFTKKEDIKFKKVMTGLEEKRLAEKIRHEEEMTNIIAEIAALEKKLSVIRGLQEHVMKVGQKQEETVDEGAPFDPKKFEADLDKAIAAGASAAMPSLEEHFSVAAGEGVEQGVAEGVQKGLFEGVKVEGMPLEEWKAAGRKQGNAIASGVSEGLSDSLRLSVEKDVADIPVKVSVSGVKEQSIDDLLDTVQTELDNNPGDLTFDFAAAHQAIRSFVMDASSKYKVSIATELKADGGVVQQMASGGRIPGQDSPKDSVHVMARPGEWFIKNEAVKSWNDNVGSWFMKGINWPGSDAGRRLHELLDLNGNLMVQNRNIRRLAQASGSQSGTSMPEFGTVNLNLPGDGVPIPVAVKPNDAAELFKQLNSMQRLSS